MSVFYYGGQHLNIRKFWMSCDRLGTFVYLSLRHHYIARPCVQTVLIIEIEKIKIIKINLRNQKVAHIFATEWLLKLIL